jgi:ferrous iron transport protein A
VLSRRHDHASAGAHQENRMTRVAAELEVGQSGRVARVVGSDEISRRILEMGVTPGVEIRRLGTAPLGDPLEFEVRGYRLSLRTTEAAHIEIDPAL